MLIDAQWAVLEPLLEACRPKAKTPPQDLRRTLSAIPWRHQNGPKWSAIPQDLGPWWRAAQTFSRWSRGGVWERLLALVQERGVQLGMVFLDGTNLRAHQRAGIPSMLRGKLFERSFRSLSCCSDRMRGRSAAVKNPSYNASRYAATPAKLMPLQCGTANLSRCRPGAE